MKLNFRTYEKISYRGFFRLLENRREAFELYATDLKRCLENPQAEYPFLGELDLALEDDYEITSRDVSVKRDFKERLYERLKTRADALSIGVETAEEFFIYAGENMVLNP